MKIRRIVFTPLLEGGKPAVRPPTKGEWFEFPDGETGVEHSGHAHVPYPILVRTEEEVEVPDPPVVYEWVAKAVPDISEGWGPSADHKTAETLSRHAAAVSPERLCLMVMDHYSGDLSIYNEAQALLAKWVRR